MTNQIKTLFFFLFLSNTEGVLAQKDSTNNLKLTGYVETFYTFDFNEPTDGKRQKFLYNHNRHNTFGINLGYLKATYNTNNVRANLGLMAGTYVEDNLSNEPSVLRHLFEANVGFKLSKKHNLWLDVGVMPSHIGFESAVGKDCWTLTRSLIAENSPYFETGAKVTYTTSDEKWLLSALVLNGWQNISRSSPEFMPALGTQILWKPNKRITLNYSTYFGEEAPTSVTVKSNYRFYQNLYGIFQLHENTGLTLGFDQGFQELKTKSIQQGIQRTWKGWFSPIIILRQKINDKWSMSGRGEYFSDTNSILTEALETFGYSFNIDYSPSENAILRLEMRGFSSDKAQFRKENVLVNNNFAMTLAAGVSF